MVSTPKPLLRLLFILLLGQLALAQSGCTTLIMDDYPQYLTNNKGKLNLTPTDLTLGYEISDKTKNHSFSFRSWMAGIANSWVVEFGKTLKATLDSTDFRKAFKSVDPGKKSDQLYATFALVNYEFVDNQAKVDLHVSVKYKNKVIVDKTYNANGNRQVGKMFWGGGLALKNAVQQSTKAAMDKILTELIADTSSSLKSAKLSEQSPAHLPLITTSY